MTIDHDERSNESRATQTESDYAAAVAAGLGRVSVSSIAQSGDTFTASLSIDGADVTVEFRAERTVNGPRCKSVDRYEIPDGLYCAVCEAIDSALPTMVDPLQVSA